MTLAEFPDFAELNDYSFEDANNLHDQSLTDLKQRLGTKLKGDFIHITAEEELMYGAMKAI